MTVIIADGLKGTEYRELPVRGGELCTTAKIGSAVADADVIVSVTHFKGHEMTGFGGTLKNLGMGAASVGGKLQLHSDSQPYIDAAQCKGCMLCVRACAHGALSLNAQRIAQIDYHRCVGCGQCVAVCQHNAARVENNTTSKNLNYKIAEYTQAILQDKPHFHISFIMNVSPECDCWASNDAAIVPDLGMAASFDPVALDMACAHLVMGAPILKDSALHTRALQAAVPAAEPKDCGCKHHDKFKLLHPDTDWRSGLEHAQKLGLGTMDFQLEII